MFYFEEPKGQEYKNLIEYALGNSDVVMFVVRRDWYRYDLDYVLIKRISNLLKISTQDFIKDYKGYIHSNYSIIRENIFSIFKDIIDKKEINLLIKIHMLSIYLKQSVETEIENKRNFEIQERSISKIKDDLKEDLIKEKHNPKWTGNEIFVDEEIEKNSYKYNNKYLFDICFYRKSNKLKNFLLKSANSLHEFLPPYLPEDISFFKNGYCWLETVTHEEIYTINIKNKEEYEKLISMGIKLNEYDEKYINKETELWHEDYQL